jgi:lauroyl/myristoyl acyltransferase
MSEESTIDESGSRRLTVLQRVLSSRAVTGGGMLLSRYTPPPVGHAVARVIAESINLLKPLVYRALYSNLRHVLGPDADPPAVHRVTRRAVRNNARNIYDLWHALAQGLESVVDTVHIPPETVSIYQQALDRGRGLIIAGVHTGNFDLGILALAARGADLQVLGLAEPPTGGFELMDQMRSEAGVHLTSISPTSLREAIRRLRSGGVILTGVDRPVGQEKQLRFFGATAMLPTGHVRLALKTDAAISVASAYYDPLKGHVARLAPLLEMVRTGDRAEDLRVNLRRVAAQMEEFIRARPDQWTMFLPVWPDQPAE